MITQIEIQILNAIQSVFRTDFLDGFFTFISLTGSLGLIWIGIAAGLLLDSRYRRVGIAIIVSLGVAVVMTFALKYMVDRSRPYIVNSDFVMMIAPPSGKSFPSGHASSTFAALFSIYFFRNKFSKAYRWPFALMVVYGLLIAFSRLYLYVHFPTDVIAGALVGVCSAWIAHKVLKEKCNPM